MSKMEFLDTTDHNGKKVNFDLLFLWLFVPRVIKNVIFAILLLPFIPFYPKVILGEIISKIHRIYWEWIYCHPRHVFRSLVRTSNYRCIGNKIENAAPEVVNLADVFVNEHTMIFGKDYIYRENLPIYHDASYMIKEYKKRTPKKLYLIRNMLMMEALLPRRIIQYFEKKAIDYVLTNKKIINLDSKRKKLVFTSYYYINYAHFMVEIMPNLYLIKDNIGEYDIILPKNYYTYDPASYIMPVLKAFGVKEEQVIYIGTNEVFEIKDLVTFKNTKFNKELSQKAIKHLKEFYRNEFKTNLGERLYFQRVGMSRAIANEGKVREFLESEGFTTVQPEKYDVIQQMSLMENAECIVGINGTAIHGNIIFAEKPLTVIEFRHKSVYGYPTCTTNFIKAKLRYVFMYCKITNIFKGWFKSNLIVDIKKLRRCLKKYGVQKVQN